MVSLFPCSNASSVDEITRQKDKIVETFIRLDADIIGISQIQNDDDTSIVDLVNTINTRAGANAYAHIQSGALGSNDTKVGIIYKQSTVQAEGPVAILNQQIDGRFLDNKHRPSLAQTFIDTNNNGRLTIVVSHFKDSHSPCDDVNDPDLDDGQGACAQTRNNAARALTAWVASDPTNSLDSDFLLIGNFNAYRKDQAIQTILGAGYIDTIESRNTGNIQSYTIVSDRAAGSVDYIFSSLQLNTQIQDTLVWAINSDETQGFDYRFINQSFLYEPNPFRSSDHDVVVVGLDLTPDEARDDIDAGIDEQDAGAPSDADDELEDGGQDAQDDAEIADSNIPEDTSAPQDDIPDTNSPDLTDTNDLADAGTPETFVDAGSETTSFPILSTCQTTSSIDLGIYSIMLLVALGYIRRHKERRS